MKKRLDLKLEYAVLLKAVLQKTDMNPFCSCIIYLDVYAAVFLYDKKLD